MATASSMLSTRPATWGVAGRSGPATWASAGVVGPADSAAARTAVTIRRRVIALAPRRPSRAGAPREDTTRVPGAPGRARAEGRWMNGG